MKNEIRESVISMAKKEADRNEIISTMAAMFDRETDREDLANEIWGEVCGMDPAFHEYMIEMVDDDADWRETGAPDNGSRAQSLYRDFAEASALGDWDGYNLESVQELLQTIMDAVCDR